MFSNRVQLSGSTFRPNTDLKPSYMDEMTIALQRQFGQSTGMAVRFITRDWNNLIEDVRTFNPDNTFQRQVVNYDPAVRKYRGVQMTLEKRLANNWNTGASYTYSRTTGNHFVDSFSGLGDYLDAQCRTTLDTTIGNGGVVPCAEVSNGSNKYGAPIYDRPHNIKLNAAYTRPFGPVLVTVAGLSDLISKRRYEKQRTVNVLRPGTLTNAGPTLTYFYTERGANQLEGLENYLDFATDVTWKVAGTHQAGFKAEIFNITNNEEQTINNNVTWCGTTATAACTTAVNNFGKASARGSFLQPRRFRDAVCPCLRLGLYFARAPEFPVEFILPERGPP